jgi:predicted dehydrogenase
MHIPALKSHPHAKLVAICGRNQERANEIAQKHEIPHVFADYHELITKGDIDALVVATPDDLHYPVIMAALDAGLHVICEKPVALSIQHAREMYEKATAAGVKHMTYFTYRWLPYAQYLHQCIQEGYLGRVYHSEFRYVAGFRRQAQYRWSWDRQRSLGALGALGSHMIDLARWCLGDVANVSAYLGTCIAHSLPDGTPLDVTNDAATLTLEFQSGSYATIHCSEVAHLGNQLQAQSVRLYGEEGTLEVEAHWSEGLRLEYVIRCARRDEKAMQIVLLPQAAVQGIDSTRSSADPFDHIFTTQAVGCRLFIDAIVHDHALAPSLYDGLKVQEIIEAAIQSYQQATWVNVS